MATMTETIETKPKLTLADLKELLATPEGRSALQAASKTPVTIEKPHTEDEIKRFYKLAEREDDYWYRIDPTTQKPLEEAKTFVWKIVCAYPNMIGACKIRETNRPSGDLRVTFQIQKCYKDKYTAKPKDATADPALPLAEGDSIQVRQHWNEVDSEGGLSTPGDRMIDASDFVKQFKREELTQE